jgi:hypothetical protein
MRLSARRGLLLLSEKREDPLNDGMNDGNPSIFERSSLIVTSNLPFG